MLIQTFVENAVIHGITPKGEGKVLVQFYKNGCDMLCEVIDDGVGIQIQEDESSDSLAMKLSEKRLNLLNSQSDNKLQLKVQNRMEKEKTNGTKVTVIIPVC